MGNKGYVLKDKKSIFIDEQVKIGKNVIIYENNRIEGDSVIEDNVTIFPNSFIVNSIIGKGSKIYSSLVESSKIGAGCMVGPYCHLKRVECENGIVIQSLSKLKNKKIVKEKLP